MPGEGTCARIVIPELVDAREDSGLTAMRTSEKLRTVVVDDEQLAREELCFLLGQIAGVDVVAQAGDGVAALDVIAEHTPDLVMLDVQMPGLTGFEVARRLLRGGTDSHLVFVTAYDRHAIEAFDVNAVDYLLKPVEAERLATAVERVRKRMVADRGRNPAGATESGPRAAAARRAPEPPGAAGGQGRRPVPSAPGRRGCTRFGRGRRNHGCNEQLVRNV